MSFSRTGVSRPILFVLVAALPMGAAAASLELDEAVRLAQANDPVMARLQANAEGLADRAVADGQLPDPKLKFGLMNFPTDSFSRSQEPMTQVQLGVQQMFPPGRSLDLKRDRTDREAAEKRLLAEDRRLGLTRAVRQVWLELYYYERALEVVAQNRGLFSELLEVTRRQYAAGKRNQQDVIRAELELNLLVDREFEIRGQQERQRAELARWVGAELADRPLGETLPALTEPLSRDAIRDRLPSHPLVEADNLRIEAERLGVKLAQQGYKPGWMLDLTYGLRDGDNANGSARADFASVMVVMDIPLFSASRQDRRVGASQRQLEAARLGRDDRLRELTQLLDSQYASWRRLGDRLDLYRRQLTPQARENSEASLNAYQSDLTDFPTLMRARTTELNTRLQALRLRVERAKVQSSLLYLMGEPS